MLLYLPTNGGENMDTKILNQMHWLNHMKNEEKRRAKEEERIKAKGLEISTMMVGFLSEHQDYSVSGIIYEFFKRYGEEKTNALWALINDHFETIVKSIHREEITTQTR